MNQKIIIGIVIAVIIIAIIYWWIKKSGKRKPVQSSTPSNTGTGTGGIRKVTYDQPQQPYQQVPPVNSGMRMGQGGVPSGGQRVEGNQVVK